MSSVMGLEELSSRRICGMATVGAPSASPDAKYADHTALHTSACAHANVLWVLHIVLLFFSNQIRYRLSPAEETETTVVGFGF